MHLQGKCLCGAVTLTVDTERVEFHACHCGMCQAWHGGPAIATEVDSVTFGGDGRVGRYRSSDWAERGFCERCGSALFYRVIDSDRTFLYLGSFDDIPGVTLAGEIFIDEKPGAYAFVGDHPRLTGAEAFAAFGADQGDA